MPADSGIGFGCEASRMSDCCAASARVSEMVVKGFEESSAISDSIAAIAGVREESFIRFV